MYRGVGNPAFVRNNVVYTLPKPKKGGRKERYVSLRKVYENIDLEKIPGELKFRFEGEYEFGKVDQNTIDTIISVYNSFHVVKWIPHSDFPAIKYDVIIAEMTPESLEGLINLDSVKIKVESRSPVFKIPSIDNMYGCFLFNRVARI